MLNALTSRLLSVVIPVRNEQENILPLIGEIRQVLDGRFDYEIVYVDDGSIDETPARLREAQAGFDRLRVIRHVSACGQSAAIATGVKGAGGSWIATLDGDGQNDPADIPRLLDAALEAKDPLLLLAGQRAKRRDNWIRRMSSRIANGVRARLLGDGTPDTGCGLKVFSRTLFMDLPRFDHMHRFMSALVLRAGGRVISVPVNHRPRLRGTSKYGIMNRLWVSIVDLFGVMWLQRRGSRPVIEPGGAGMEPGGAGIEPGGAGMAGDL